MTGEQPMNSINKKETLIFDQFYLEEIKPLAKQLHSKNESVFFLKKPGLAKETYFNRRKITTMTSEDFDAGSCNSPESLKIALIKLWVDEGNNELLNLPDAIVKLAESAHRTNEQSSEVSPFIYVMF